MFQNRQLQDDTLITRQRALNALCDVLHNPEHVSAALKVGKFHILTYYCSWEIRLLSALLNTYKLYQVSYMY